ncbi:unnamed protein product, partial [Rotaria magnacalcarata]
MVYGDSSERFLIGIVVLNDEYIKQSTSNEGYDYQGALSTEMETNLK